MYCIKCGKENPDENRFCEFCGAEIADVVHCDSVTRSTKKMVAKMVLLFVVILAVVIVSVFYFDSRTNSAYDAKIREANKYAKSQDYERAEMAFLEAIEIDAKQTLAYLGVSDVYVDQKKYKKAEGILEKGKNETGSKEIYDKLDTVELYVVYYDYINNTIIPETGLADVGSELNEYTQTPGLVSALVDDFNGDGAVELLTVKYKDSEMITVTISLYTHGNDTVELVDEEKNACVSGMLAGTWDIFLKENDGKFYVVISCERLHTEGGMAETYLYETSNEIEESVCVANISDLGYCAYEINGSAVAEYEDAPSDYDSARYEATCNEGIIAFKDALKQYGFGEDRICHDFKYIGYDYIKCDDDETSETHICKIRHGVYEDDGGIDVLDGGATRYIEDYTGLRDGI